MESDVFVNGGNGGWKWNGYRGRHTPEFKGQAVKLYEESGLSLAECAKRLSMPKGSLKNSVDAAKQGRLNDMGRNQKPLSELELELARAKRELVETRMEGDFLKNARPISRRRRGEIQPD